MKIWKFGILFLVFSLSSCGTHKKAGVVSWETENKKERTPFAEIPDFVDLGEEIIEDLEGETYNIIDHALQFLGTKYKYGGTSPEGMDCSGLVYTSFLQKEIELPRSSRDMALLGEELQLTQVKTGDLLFFKTDRRKKNINHVGLVVELDHDRILFIHSSTSRGVIISGMDENYWREHFVMARRIL
ncbi:C40 family peptidase [Salinimicrobium xinjiangense]|uniref:C40 family peptidase n=1 Tax=Salinimicrobium xinjiangense TaxID=438596 RepID=UPI000418BC04|nr:C40 family peptidase [Salinimicrobium xinjiangense]